MKYDTDITAARFSYSAELDICNVSWTIKIKITFNPVDNISTATTNL